MPPTSMSWSSPDTPSPAPPPETLEGQIHVTLTLQGESFGRVDIASSRPRWPSLLAGCTAREEAERLGRLYARYGRAQRHGCGGSYGGGRQGGAADTVSAPWENRSWPSWRMNIQGSY